MINNNLYLKFPTLDEENKWKLYVKEFTNEDSNNNPLSYTEDMDYAEWLIKITDNHNGVNLKNGYVPSTPYFLMDDNRILGHISIRHNINAPHLSRYVGHIGYGVRPSERKKGYATKMLSLGLEKCKELGLEEVMVTCKKDNIGSSKTIMNNGGKLIEEIFVPEEDSVFQKYIIKI